MSELNPKLPQELEQALAEYYSVPMPSAEFAARLEVQLRRKLEQATGKQNITERISFMKLFRTRPVVAILIVLLILLVLSGVVYAVGRSLGYIPGIGVIDQSVPIRVLAEPVPQTRDGVTVTVKEAVLSSDKTTMIYSVENIPFASLSHREDVIGCMSELKIRLPDGTVLQSEDLNSVGGSRIVFGAIPADVNDATLMISCLMYTLPGLAPENWELPLHFIPAPPDMTAVPVIEYTPVPADTPLPSSNQENSEPKQNPISITKAIDTGDSYILMGEFRSTSAYSSEHNLKLRDANGVEIPWDTPIDIDQSQIPDSEVWAVKFDKTYALPIQVVYAESIITIDSSRLDTYEFEFDAGSDPQIGQNWELNQQIELAGYKFILASISIRQGGGCGECSSMLEYVFSFISPEPLTSIELPYLGPGLEYFDSAYSLPDSRVNSYVVNIDGYSSLGGSRSITSSTSWEIGNMYSDNPTGKLKIKISDLPGNRELKEWSVDWQPDGLSSSPTSELPRACLTVDSWQAALSNPAPLPANLSGKVIGNLLDSNFARLPEIYVANLDGSGKEVIRNAQAGDISPDGGQVAYHSWEDGRIFLLDLRTGETQQIPGTISQDVNPRWSPDGKRIAFNRGSENKLYVINPDGTQLKQVGTDSIGGLFGWSPDGRNLFYRVTGHMFNNAKKLDLETGMESDLLSPIENIDWVSISPDGTKAAYLRFFSGNGQMTLYVSQPDGSASRLVAQDLSLRPLGWSPDGKWLLVGITNGDDPDNIYLINTLVNPQTCEIIPLQLEGEIQSWVP